MIIWLPVQIALCRSRANGALVVVVAAQLSVEGLYFPPVCILEKEKPLLSTWPPQTIISVPVQIPVKSSRPAGALVVVVAVQLSLEGLYLPPVLKLT
jgi:hypothetical protein